MSNFVWHVYTGFNATRLITVYATATLDTQVVEFSINGGSTWLTGTWQGTAATERKASVTLLSAGIPAAGTYPVIVRLTPGDGPFPVGGQVTVH